MTSSASSKAIAIARELEDIEYSEDGIVHVDFTQQQMDFAEDNKMCWDECDTRMDSENNDGGDEEMQPRRYDISWRRVCMCVDCGMLMADSLPSSQNCSNL